MRKPEFIRLGVDKGRLLFSEQSFFYFFLKLGLSYSQLRALPGVTHKIIVVTRAKYGRKYSAQLSAAKRANYQRAKFGNCNGKRVPAILLGRDALTKHVELGTSVTDMARIFRASEWFIMRNCEHYNLWHKGIRPATLSATDCEALRKYLPSLDVLSPDPEVMEAGLLEAKTVVHMLSKLGLNTRISDGEFVVASNLRARGIQYHREFLITTEKSKGSLRVDFFVPQAKTVIEVNGSYHAKSKDRDSRVRKMCAHNKYRLITIPYTQITNQFIKEVTHALDSL